MAEEGGREREGRGVEEAIGVGDVVETGGAAEGEAGGISGVGESGAEGVATGSVGEGRALGVAESCGAVETEVGEDEGSSEGFGEDVAESVAIGEGEPIAKTVAQGLLATCKTTTESRATTLFALRRNLFV